MKFEHMNTRQSKSVRTANSRRRQSQALGQKGFSLLELMIALAIGILLLASVLMVIVNATRSGRVSDAETAMNEEGMIALGLLQQQIRLAGYSNTFEAAGSDVKNFAGTSIRGCDNGFADAGVAFNSLTCNATAGTASNGAIAIRYEADVLNTTPTAGGLPTNCALLGITRDTPSAAAGAVNFALADNRYYVRSSGTDSGRPELSCRGATSNAAYAVVDPLIENIEQLRFTYGIVASIDPEDRQIVTYINSEDLDTNYSGESMQDRWSRVRSVKICVLMRSAETARDGTSQSYRDCWGNVQQSSDGYLRRAYITTAQLRNKASVPWEKL